MIISRTMPDKIYYKTENGEFKELKSINKIDSAPETISFDKQSKAIEFAIEASMEFKAALCFALGEYSPYKNTRCRTCRIANMCIIEKINKKYRGGIKRA